MSQIIHWLKEQLPSAAKLEYRPKPLGDRFLGNLYTKKNNFWNQKNISAKFQIFFFQSKIYKKNAQKKITNQKKSSDILSESFFKHIRKRSWKSVGTFFLSWRFFCFFFKIWSILNPLAAGNRLSFHEKHIFSTSVFFIWSGWFQSLWIWREWYDSLSDKKVRQKTMRRGEVTLPPRLRCSR